MKILHFFEATNTMRIDPESFEDLYLIAIVINAGDHISAKSTRRFKPNEGDKGEQKDVHVTLAAEKIEIDKSAGRLRITGKIISGKPEEFVQINSYHTLNIAPYDKIEIQKPEWKDYILRRLKQAVADSRRPRLGIIAMDDEKATAAYIRGYGIDIIAELYSHLSKKMKEKDFEKQKVQYFEDLIKTISELRVDIVILAGPGFTKEDLKKYISDKNIEIKKKLAYAAASDAERSGIREVMQGEVAAKLLEGEHVKKEFGYLNLFLTGLRINKSVSGTKRISELIESRSIGVILVNDSALKEKEIEELLDTADRIAIKIEIFNSEDEAGNQLKSFHNIVALDKSLLNI